MAAELPCNPYASKLGTGWIARGFWMKRRTKFRTKRKIERSGSPSIARNRAQPSAGAAVALMCLVAGVTASLPARAADPFLRRTAAVRVVEKVGPSVVNITTDRPDAKSESFKARDANRNNFYRDLLGPRELEPKPQILGSGVIIHQQRHVLTHFLDDLTVTFHLVEPD